MSQKTYMTIDENKNYLSSSLGNITNMTAYLPLFPLLYNKVDKLQSSYIKFVWLENAYYQTLNNRLDK